MKVNYEGSDGKGYDFTAYLRIQKDSVIWISVQTIIGEAFRILITSDSVKMISKFGKTKGLILRSVGYLQEAAGVPFDFKTMQDLLIGNPVYLNSNIGFL